MPATSFIPLFSGLFIASCISSSALAGSMVASPDASPAPSYKRVSIDLEERLRYEFRENTFDFNNSADAPTDGSFLLQRARLGVALRPASWLTFYAQVQSAFEFGDRGDLPGVNAAEGDDAIDLYQAYVEIADYDQLPIGLKLGRQAFNYGDQRLVGSFDWNNLGRTFDAVRVRYQQERFWLEAFAGSVVVVEHSGFNQSALFNDTTDQVFSGLYASTSAIASHTLDAYLLWLFQENGNSGNTRSPLPAAGSQGGDASGGMNVATLGARVKNDPKASRGWEYDAEVAGQIGRLAGLDLAAYALHIGAGYESTLPWSPRVYLQYNHASGDRNSTDDRSTTFQNLFPTNHKFYGYMDLFSWQNMHNPSVTLSAKPHKDITLAADLHFFWLASTDDAWYRANGINRARPVNATASSYVGSELDVTAQWKPHARLGFLAGYSLFMPGDYVRQTGPASDAHFVYFQTEVKF